MREDRVFPAASVEPPPAGQRGYGEATPVSHYDAPGATQMTQSSRRNPQGQLVRHPPELNIAD